MSLQEIEEIFGSNVLSYNKVSMAQLANINKFVEVSLKMDYHSLDYYYEIDIEELVNSPIPKDELEVMRDQGWSLSDDKKHLILFLKNN